MEKEKHVAKVKKIGKGLALEPEKQEEFKENLKKIKSKGKEEKGSGVVYLGHLPHGFYEDQLKKYMSQFGKVKAVKVSRSNKTGKSKGYAFVEFQSDDVARIVADTMNNYLVFERLIKCQYIPSEKLHPKTMGRRNGVFKPPKAHIIARDRHNNRKTEFKQEKSIKRLLKKQKKKSDMLKVLGIDLKMNSLEKVLETGKKIIVEKEREKMTGETAETNVMTVVKANAKTPNSAKKSKTDSKSTLSSDATPKAPSTPSKVTPMSSKATPLTSKKAKTPKGTPAVSEATEQTPKVISPAATPATSKATPLIAKKAKTPKGTPAVSEAIQQTPKTKPLGGTPATSKATPLTSKKAKTPKGTPAISNARQQTPKATPLAATPATSKPTPVHKVTPMPHKKNKKTVAPETSLKDQSMEILMEDSEEEDISFKTPPNAIRSSRTPLLSASAKKKRAQSGNSNTPIRKINEPQSKKKRKSLE
ncbi:MKI67 FHA domain-interacting nucleolar phosphoprotein-like [Saccostrea echinata]|uniref:MKI67 FHA domain-interacting nucleolar phosphoprotein-like n=1 Tax=Saccostrea echinata TaxID=191078 RepID=UPI002A80E5D7|nr:MKI67 FHA domain-interacting nucleolar phosphoprotein-like [Saccostrea echinata]